MGTMIAFDMDGVVISPEDFSVGNWFRQAFMDTLNEFGIPETEENARALYVGNMRKNAASFCRRFGISDPQKLWERREEHYIREKLAALKRGQITLYPDVAHLQDLSQEYPLALVSNAPQLVVARVVVHFSLSKLFRVWIGRGSLLTEIQHAKPAPDLLERVKEMLNITNGYYVGDEPEDVEAARAAALHPILLARDGGPGDIDSLSELRKYIVRRSSTGKASGL